MEFVVTLLNLKKVILGGRPNRMLTYHKELKFALRCPSRPEVSKTNKTVKELPEQICGSTVATQAKRRFNIDTLEKLILVVFKVSQTMCVPGVRNG